MPEKKYFVIRLSYVFLLCLCVNFLYAQPTLDWVKQFKGTGSDEGLCIKTDNAGNIYTAGYFWGLTDFDPGPGVDTLRAIGTDGFITKFDAQGSLIWAKHISGYSSQPPLGLVLDDSSNVYATGMFSGATDFDPGPGTYNLTPPTIDGSLYVLKLNSFGNFVWAKQFNGDWFQDVRGMAIDKNGNLYTTGMFSASFDFDPGPSVYSLSVIDGPINGYVLKLDNLGNFLWARQFTGSSAHGNAIAVDLFENVYTTGAFGGTVCDFDPGLLTYTLATQGNFDIFVNKLDKNGNFLWTKQLGSNSNSDYAYAIALDQYNNVYCGGYMGESFITKMDSMGTLVWTHQINFGIINGLAVNGSEHIIGVGKFGGSCDFDPGVGVDSIASAGNYDAFIVELNSNGNYICGGAIGGSDIDAASAVTIDNFQNICITGWFADTADFSPGAGIFNLISTSGPNTFERGNVFVGKYSSCQLITEAKEIEIEGSSSFSAFPNPTNNILHLGFSQKVAVKEIQMYDMLGQRVECKFNLVTLTIEIQILPPGNYLLRVETEDNFYSKIIVKE